MILFSYFYIISVQVKDLTEQFPAATPLALVLKQFLADRSLDQSYSGGLSSYCLVINTACHSHIFSTCQVHVRLSCCFLSIPYRTDKWCYYQAELMHECLHVHIHTLQTKRGQHKFSPSCLFAMQSWIILEVLPRLYVVYSFKISSDNFLIIFKFCIYSKCWIALTPCFFFYYYNHIV